MVVSGEKKVLTELMRAQIRYPAAFGAALYSEGVGIYHAARARVPIDSGYLRDSAYVTRPNPKAQRISIEVGFGAEHATLQHEETQYLHTQGEAKYLQKALEDRSSGFLERLAAQTQRNVDARVETVTALVPGKKGSRTRGRLTRASQAAGRRRR